ncbi:MAG: apolipoprotein N-acyltransferase [Desulfobacterales bacterium]
MLFDRGKAEKARQAFLCTAAGTALTCAFPGVGAHWCAWFALTLLLTCLRDTTPRRAALLGLGAGFIHFLTLLYWLVPTMHTYAPMPLALSAGVLVFLAFYLALYIAAFSGLVVWCSRGRLEHPLWCLAMVPVFWVSLEWLRGHLFTGFPWGLIGYSQYSRLHLIQLADIFGVYGVSFLLAFVNAALFILVLAISGRCWQDRAVAVRHALFVSVAAVLMITGAWGYGNLRIKQMDGLAEDAPEIRLAVIQGNIDQSLKWDEEFREHTTRKYIGLTQEILDDSPDLIVWPETAMPFYFFRDKELTSLVLDSVKQAGVYHLIGSPSYEYSQESENFFLFNSAYLIDPEGEAVGRYDKVHLVPFGEYVPLRRWLPFLGTMVPQEMDFSAGRAGQLLHMQDVSLGVQICYEMIFPELSSAMVRRGGDVIVNITNDTWFGRTAAPVQHFSMGVLRAVENRRAFVRAANTGISGFIDPVGRIKGASNIFETLTMIYKIPVIQNKPGFYSRCGDVLPWICMVLSLCVIFAAWREKRA